jgi:hypothetical protein
VIAQLAALASRPRWRARLLYSTAEHRAQWLALFAAACFGEDLPLRAYVFRRTPALLAASPVHPAQRPAPSLQTARRPRVRRRRLAALVTKARRLVQAEWRLARTRGRER